MELPENFTPDEVLRETGRLLEHSKSLVDRIVRDWQIKPEEYQRLPVDSAGAIARYTRWAVTGKVLQEQIDHLSTGGANAPDTWQAAKVAMLGEDVRAVEQPAQAVTLAPVPGARVGGFATGGGVAPHVGMCMAVSERAKVRAGVELESAEQGDLDHGEVIEVLEVKRNKSGQYRVRFAMEDGLAGWTSTVLRELEGPPREQPGDSCQVVSEMAIVLDGLDAEAVEVGYLMSGDVVIVDESRVDEYNAVWVRTELGEQAGWLSVTGPDGVAQLEQLQPGWEHEQLAAVPTEGDDDDDDDDDVYSEKG